MSIFPTTSFDTSTVMATTPTIGKMFAFDFETNQHILKDGKLVELTKIEAIKRYIQWTVRTALGKYEIYSNDYGVDFYFGKSKLPTGFINSEIKRQITEQLENFSLILQVIDCKLEKKASTLHIKVTILTTENKHLEFGESMVI